MKSTRIQDKKALDRFISQEPLIETNPSLQGTTNIVIPPDSYFGIGLCNGSGVLTQGMPIDVLSMILTAEQVSPDKTILIADTHASANGFDKKEVDKVAGQSQETIQKTLDNLGFNRWNTICASDIDASSTYLNILNGIEASNEYIQRELADMLWFNQEKDVNLKVGWSLNGSRNSDEKSFDQEFKERFGDELSFVYTVPGKTFDPKKLRSAPYFCDNPESRILISPDENVEEKLALAKEHFGPKSTKPYEKFLNHLTRTFDKTVEKTERGPLQIRLQQVLDRCVR